MIDGIVGSMPQMGVPTLRTYAYQKLETKVKVTPILYKVVGDPICATI